MPTFAQIDKATRDSLQAIGAAATKGGVLVNYVVVLEIVQPTGEKILMHYDNKEATYWWAKGALTAALEETASRYGRE